YHQSSGTPAMRMAIGEPGSTVAGSGSRRRTISTISAIRRPRSAAIGSAIIARPRGRIGMLDDGISRINVRRETTERMSDPIRRHRPDLLICQNPLRTYQLGASHRDHRVVGGVALDCVYPLSRDHLAFPELMPEFEPHKVREVYIMQWQDPHVVVDIGEVMDL